MSEKAKEYGAPTKSKVSVGRGGATERADFGGSAAEGAERSQRRRVPKFRFESEAEKLQKSKLRMEKGGEELERAREKLSGQKPVKPPGPVKRITNVAKAEYTKAASDLEALKAEVIKTIRGESAFSKELLGSLITEAETKCTEAGCGMNEAQADYEEGQDLLASLNAQYDDIISWADMYDTASIEAKKMIVNCLIKRIDVYRDYRLHIDFNIDLEQFGLGLDINAA